MEILTPLQVNNLANNFLAIGNALGEFRYRNVNSLSDAQNRQLELLCGVILKYADDSFTWSAQLVMEDARASLSSLRKVTEKLKTTLKTLNDVQKGINTATSAVIMGNAILARDPKRMANALINLEKQLTG